MKIPVSKTYALVDDSCAWLTDFKWHLDSDGYAINFKNKLRMHRMVMFAEPGTEIDHINGNRLDNRRENLRLLTHKENVQNGSAHKDSISRFKGVSRRRNGWRTQFCHDNKKMLIGQFPSEHLAAVAYDLWAKPLGRKTNFLSIS